MVNRLLGSVLLAVWGPACAGSVADSLVRYMAKSEKHRLISVSEPKIHPIEDSLYGTLSWRSYSFKASRPMHESGKEKYFFAYYAEVLSLPDSAHAARRLDSVRAYYLPEDLAVKKTQFGFRIGNEVVLLATYPVKYAQPLRALASRYRKKAPSAVPDRFQLR